MLDQCLYGFTVTRLRRGRRGALHQMPPQLGLPGQVRRQLLVGAVTIAPGLPLLQHLGSLCGIGGKQAGDPAYDAVAAPFAKVIRVIDIAQVFGQWSTPGLIGVLVDDAQQRPHHRRGRPRIKGASVEQLRVQARWRAEGHSGADTISIGPDAEAVREMLAQPALGALCRGDHQLGGEGVWQRCRQQICESFDEAIGTCGPVDHQSHVG